MDCSWIGCKPKIELILKPEAVAANRRLENRAEHICRPLDFRHSYLTIESVSGPKEMWYFNGFESQSEIEKLRREYTQNTKLAAALADIVQQRRCSSVPSQPTNLRIIVPT